MRLKNIQLRPIGQKVLQKYKRQRGKNTGLMAHALPTNYSAHQPDDDTLIYGIGTRSPTACSRESVALFALQADHWPSCSQQHRRHFSTAPSLSEDKLLSSTTDDAALSTSPPLSMHSTAALTPSVLLCMFPLHERFEICSTFPCCACAPCTNDSKFFGQDSLSHATELKFSKRYFFFAGGWVGLSNESLLLLIFILQNLMYTKTRHYIIVQKTNTPE